MDITQIEECVKSRLESHLIKLITDTVCYTSLEKLKADVIDCINLISQHICHCVKCSKIYNVELHNNHYCNIVTVNDFIDCKEKRNIVKKSSKKPTKKPSKKPSKRASKILSKKSLKKK